MFYPRKALWVSTILLSTLALMTVGNVKSAKPYSHNRTPRFVKMYLSGYRLSLTQKNFGVYDGKKGYFILSGNDEQDGSAFLQLLPNADKNSKDVSRVTLPSLGTRRDGKGVNIGDSPQQVRHKLGNPTASNEERIKDDDPKVLVYTYAAIVDMQKPKARSGVMTKRYYRGIYTFVKNRLWSIELDVEDPDAADR